MTKLMYIEYPNLFEESAKILNYGHDSKSMYLVLDQTIFYPQGGGQPADQGEIVSKDVIYKVFDVRNVDNEVRHYIINNIEPTHLGGIVKMRVDEDRRWLNSRYHTSGHLIAAVVEKMLPELMAVKGHQFPNEAYVEFNGIADEMDVFLTKLSACLQDMVRSDVSVNTEILNPMDAVKVIEKLPYEVPTDKPLRVCSIEGFPSVPCGGTHVEKLKDIFSLSIKKGKLKKGRTKVYYEV